MSVAIEAERQPTHTPALVVLTTLFFVWGLLTSLNDILVPHLKAIFTLSRKERSPFGEQPERGAG